MKTIINNHNKNILEKKPSINTSTGNCQNKEAYPLNGKYQIGEAVYKGALLNNKPNYKEKKIFSNCGGIFQRTPVQPQFIFQK